VAEIQGSGKIVDVEKFINKPMRSLAKFLLDLEKAEVLECKSKEAADIKRLDSNFKGRIVKKGKFIDIYQTEDGFAIRIRAKDGGFSWSYLDRDADWKDFHRLADDEQLIGDDDDYEQYKQMWETKEEWRERQDEVREGDMHWAGYQDRDQRDFEENLAASTSPPLTDITFGSWPSAKLEAMNASACVNIKDIKMVKVHCGERSTNGLVSGGKVLIPCHVVLGRVTDRAELMARAKRDTKIRIEGLLPNGEAKTLVYDLSEFTHCKRAGEDMVDVMWAPNRGLASCKAQIAKATNITRLNKDVCMLVKLNDDLSPAVGPCKLLGQTKQALTISGREVQVDLWKHDVGTQGGDCGSLLLASSTEANSQLKVIGWHMYNVPGKPNHALDLTGITCWAEAVKPEPKN